MTWQAVQAKVQRRISERVWEPGALIPGEKDLAEEFGCARATVNRALRQLAEAGLLERRRKGGTRVTRHPVRKATLDISITRHEVEQRGKAYSFNTLSKRLAAPPKAISAAMKLPPGEKHLHIKTLHKADGRPFMFEDRWINTLTVPHLLDADLSQVNANEWLVENALFTHGSISFSAAGATKYQAQQLAIEPEDAVFIIQRSTWQSDHSITLVKLAYTQDFKMRTQI